MNNYEPINLVQQVQASPNQYDRNKFMELLNALNQQDFNNFCREILELSEFHDSNVGAICTDNPEKIKTEPDDHWELK